MVGEGERDARGLPHGKGTMVFKRGAGVYEGEWKRGAMEGKGVFREGGGSGERYVGTFVANVRTGRGTYFYNTGDRYEGEYLNGQRHGTVILMY